MSQIEQVFVFGLVAILGLFLVSMLRMLHVLEVGVYDFLRMRGYRVAHNFEPRLPGFSTEYSESLILLSSFGIYGFIVSLFDTSVYLAITVASIAALFHIGLSLLCLMVLTNSGWEINEQRCRQGILYTSFASIAFVVCQSFDQSSLWSVTVSLILAGAHTYFDHRVRKTWNW